MRFDILRVGRATMSEGKGSPRRTRKNAKDSEESRGGSSFKSQVRWRRNVRFDETSRRDDNPVRPRLGHSSRFPAFDVELTRGATDRRAFRGPEALNASGCAPGISTSVSEVWIAFCESFSKFAKAQDKHRIGDLVDIAKQAITDWEQLLAQMAIAI